MPAVAGSSRRKSAGPSARPTSRAICPAEDDERDDRGDPHRHVAARSKHLIALVVEDQHAGEQRQQHEHLDPRALHRARRLSCRASPASAT